MFKIYLHDELVGVADNPALVSHYVKCLFSSVGTLHYVHIAS